MFQLKKTNLNLLRLIKAVLNIVSMKYFNGSIFFAIIFLVILSAVPVSGYAQLGDPGEDPDAQVPVDDGVILLIAAGAGYGLKKAMDHRKKNTALFIGGKM